MPGPNTPRALHAAWPQPLLLESLHDGASQRHLPHHFLPWHTRCHRGLRETSLFCSSTVSLLSADAPGKAGVQILQQSLQTHLHVFRPIHREITPGQAQKNSVAGLQRSSLGINGINNLINCAL